MTQVNTVAMSRDEQAAFLAVLERTRRLVAAGDQFLHQVVDPPVRGSPIAHAYAADERDAFDIAGMLLYACEDHLRALLVIGDAHVIPSFAGYTLLRSAAEAAVRTRHLLEPQLGHQDRLARSLNERLTNIAEQGRVLLDAAHATARIAHLEERATALSIPINRDRKGHTIGFGAPCPSKLDLFEMYFKGGATAWRVLSAYAHSMQWMLAPRSRATPSSDPAVALVSTEVDTKQLLALWAALLDAFDHDALLWVVLSGMPGDVWREARKGAGT